MLHKERPPADEHHFKLGGLGDKKQFAQTEEVKPLLSATKRAKRELVIDCLRQKILGNLMLATTKAIEEGTKIIKKYDDIKTYLR